MPAYVYKVRRRTPIFRGSEMAILPPDPPVVVNSADVVAATGVEVEPEAVEVPTTPKPKTTRRRRTKKSDG